MMRLIYKEEDLRKLTEKDFLDLGINPKSKYANNIFWIEGVCDPTVKRDPTAIFELTFKIKDKMEYLMYNPENHLAARITLKREGNNYSTIFYRKPNDNGTIKSLYNPDSKVKKMYRKLCGISRDIAVLCPNLWLKN